jgi:rubrerythrin
MRYLIYADRAKKSGYDNIVRLFSAIAHAEKIHAGNHYKNIQHKGDTTTVSRALFGSRTTFEDLQNGIDGERARAAFYERAKDAAEQDTDLELENVGVCEVCGYTVEGEAPERCPICKAKKRAIHHIQKIGD